MHLKILRSVGKHFVTIWVLRGQVCYVFIVINLLNGYLYYLLLIAEIETAVKLNFD